MKYSVEGPIEGWDQWHKMLNGGQHVTAIGGSDDHRAETYVKGVPGGKVEFIIDGKLNSKLEREVASNDEKIQVKWETDDNRHSIYIKVRARDGKLLLVGNPVYITPLARL